MVADEGKLDPKLSNTRRAFNISRLETKHVDALIGSRGFKPKPRRQQTNPWIKIDQRQPRIDVSKESASEEGEGNERRGIWLAQVKA
jgi:hypothetical protein